MLEHFVLFCFFPPLKGTRLVTSVCDYLTASKSFVHWILHVSLQTKKSRNK